MIKKKSWVIGDNPHDIDMGLKAGCRNVYLLTGVGKKHLESLKKDGITPDFVANDFLKAAEFIKINSN